MFDAIARNAARLCNGLFTSLFQFDGELLHWAAADTAASAEVVKEIEHLYPMAPTRFQGVGRAILDRTIVHIPDVELDATYRHRSLTRALGMRSGIFVAMLRGATPVGAIAVGRAEPGLFPSNEIELLKTFANQAVIAIENTRLFEAEQAGKRELQESLQYQTATAEVLSVISRSPNRLQPVLDAITQTAARLCQANYAHFRLLRDGAYHVTSSNNYDPLTLKRLTPIVPGRCSIARRVALERQTIHLPDILADATGTYSRQYREIARTGLGVPLPGTCSDLPRKHQSTGRASASILPTASTQCQYPIPVPDTNTPIDVVAAGRIGLADALHGRMDLAGARVERAPGGAGTLRLSPRALGSQWPSCSPSQACQDRRQSSPGRRVRSPHPQGLLAAVLASRRWHQASDFAAEAALARRVLGFSADPTSSRRVRSGRLDGELAR